MKNKAHTVCIIIMSLIFAAFTARLADWQLIHGEEYRRLAARADSVTVTTEAVRGEIIDRNGDGLVTNTACKRIVLEKSKLGDDLILALIGIIESCGDKWADDLPDDSEACINKLKSEYRIPDGYTSKQLRQLVSVHFGMNQSDGDFYTLANNVSGKCVSAVSEQTQGIDGVEVQTYHVRAAVQPSLAPHILGSVGAISAEEYDALSDKNYKLTDSIGKFGIEAALEDELRGKSGRRIISGNSDPDGSSEARRGNTVQLTLDSRLQKTAADSLAENIKAAKAAGADDCESGAAVMLDISDFSVLAAASCPTYDLNRYSSDGDYYMSLAENDAAPMFNRACSGSFACGSVFKPCVALAALEDGVITPGTEIYCARCYDYYPSNVVACMHYHGNENLFTALAHSCNVFFAETGRRLGIKKMSALAEKAGLGEYTGIEIEESRGVLAGRDSEEWTDGNTVQAAIGQSDNAFTPVQLATYTATIANGGRRLKTHLVRQITDYSRNEIIYEAKPETVSDLGVKQEYLDDVKKAMLAVTADPEGTAYSEFYDYPVKVGAKTGTAENAGSDHAAFICFAPFEKPEVAVSVIIEHGANTKFAMRTAKDMLSAYFENSPKTNN